MVQDLDGFGWKHFDMRSQKKFASIFQALLAPSFP
jgi:hypothetical protein